MKVKILIEDANGRTRTVTLSFEEEVTQKTEVKKATLIDRFKETLFIVHEEILSPEPHMISELHMEKLHEPEDRCRSCKEQMWILMEVIEDTEEEVEAHYPFINVDHDLIAEVCIHCGRYRRNDRMVGSGIFGLLDEEAHERMWDFLDALDEEKPDIYYPPKNHGLKPVVVH